MGKNKCDKILIENVEEKRWESKKCLHEFQSKASLRSGIHRPVRQTDVEVSA